MSAISTSQKSNNRQCASLWCKWGDTWNSRWPIRFKKADSYTDHIIANKDICFVGAYGSSRATTKWTLMLISFVVVFFFQGHCWWYRTCGGPCIRAKNQSFGWRNIASGKSQNWIDTVLYFTSKDRCKSLFCKSSCFCKRPSTSVLLFNLTSVVQQVVSPSTK